MNQNAADHGAVFSKRSSWAIMYTINVFIVVWTLVVGFGLGGWASITNFVRQIDTFGLFASCYQCPSSSTHA
jgi:auxin influx carrier (AUX1 LAX family)